MGLLRVAHLVRRGDQFWFRMAVPAQLVARIGLTEVKGSLKTADRMLARLRCRYMSNSVEALIATVKAKPDLPPETIRALVRRCFQRCRAASDDLLRAVMRPGINSTEVLEEKRADLAELRADAARAEFLPWMAIELVATAHGMNLNLDDLSFADWSQLRDGILRAHIESTRIVVARLAGQFGQTAPVDPLFLDMTGQEAATVGTQTASVIAAGTQTDPTTLRDAADKYIKLKTESGAWVKKTRLDGLRVLSLFCQLTGETVPINSLTKVHLRDFRDVLLKVPANYTKSKANEGKTLGEVVENAGGADPLSRTTADKYLQFLRAFITWCVDEGYLDAAPGGKISIPGGSKAKAKDARDPFTIEQLRRLFNSPAYTGHQSAAKRSTPGSTIVRDGKYWVPLLALFSGMRMGEIVQLTVSDVKQDADIWYFDIGEGKQLKTQSSKRKIPLHPMLQDLGFLAVVAKRKAVDEKGRLFPDIQPGKDGYHSHNFSKWFTRYSTQVKVKTSKTAFHSFRHNFKDALENAGVEESHRRALMGHADAGVHNAYGGKLSLALLASDLEKVKYDVPLEHLYMASH